MTDAHEALAQVREALAARPTPGEWHVWQYRRFSNPNVRNADGIYVMDAAPRRSVRKGVDASYIAACNPVNMTAILAHVDAQAAEIERLTKSEAAVAFEARDALLDFISENGTASEGVQHYLDRYVRAALAAKDNGNAGE